MKNTPRIRNRYLLLVDLFLIAVSVLGAYSLRLELGAGFLTYLPSALWMIGVSLLVKPIVYYFFGLYRRMWAYASIQELKIIVAAVTAASVPVALIVLTAWYNGAFDGFPRSIPFLDWVLSLIMVGGVRIVVRVVSESQRNAANQRRGFVKHALIIGAGDAGALVVRELEKNPQLNLKPVGFLDDDPGKQRQQLYGIRVVGRLSDLGHILDTTHINEVIIAIPTAPGRVVRMVSDICRRKGVPFRTMPGLYELLGGKVNVSRLREVDITDLLRREPARIRDQQVGETISGRRVMVTGGGGSIGRELCRQIARWNPSELMLLGHGENSIFEALLELNESFSSVQVIPIIADVRDAPRLNAVFQQHRPEVLFHAAAHKHVPLMETNAEDAVTNNVLGTRNVVNAALASGVEHMVMISTDKAIHPRNVMGATKRLAEMVVMDAAARSGRCFSVVRFGNVLGSRGSVVPLFKRQIARGGPITITHPDMQRFFMTIPEAVILVLQASTLGSGGDTFILNMGQQVRIVDLAEDLIRLSGLEPGKDIEIVYTGIRPGEKLSEELWEEGTPYQPTEHPEIYRLEWKDELSGERLYQVVDELVRLAQAGDTAAVLKMLDAVVPGASISANPPPDFTSIDQ